MAEAKSRTAQKDKPAGKSADAAQAERNGQPKTMDFHELKLRLPARLPFKVLRHLRNQRESSGADIYGILESILGIQQIDALCDLEVDGEPFDIEQGVDLLTDVLAEFDITLGEAPASQSS